MTLKKFKDIEVHGSATDCEAFLEKLSSSVSDGWRRAPELEERVGGTAHLKAFECVPNASRRAASLWFALREPRGLYVSNIVPKDAGRLSYDEYNLIAEEFAQKFVKPIAEELGLEFESSSGELRLDEVLSTDCYQALADFSRSANKSTGSSHPLDADRWFQFLVLSHRDNWTLNADDLGRWFRQEGWDADQTFALQVEYEQARDLLRFYDSNR